MNITLITSVINTPNTPLSYTNTRSVFNRKERFEDTKKTLDSLKKINNNKIFIIECSELNNEEKEYFKENSHYFINIYDTNNKNLINRMFTISKSLGEGTMTIYALEYLFKNHIEFDFIFKISGRYWLNNNFDYNLNNNNVNCIYKINNDTNNIFTCFYKLTKENAYKWYIFLINSEKELMNCIGFEVLFAKFIKEINNIKIIENKVGINGYVSIDRTYIDM
jgi:hypothetical protein